MAEVLFKAKLVREAITSPWGFRLQGGADYTKPLTILQVLQGSVASRCGLRDKDVVMKLAGMSASAMTHRQAQDTIIGAGNVLEILVARCDDDDAFSVSSSEDEDDAASVITVIEASEAPQNEVVIVAETEEEQEDDEGRSTPQAAASKTGSSNSVTATQSREHEGSGSGSRDVSPCAGSGAAPRAANASQTDNAHNDVLSTPLSEVPNMAPATRSERISRSRQRPRTLAERARGSNDVARTPSDSILTPIPTAGVTSQTEKSPVRDSSRDTHHSPHRLHPSAEAKAPLPPPQSTHRSPHRVRGSSRTASQSPRRGGDYSAVNSPSITSHTTRETGRSPSRTVNSTISAPKLEAPQKNLSSVSHVNELPDRVKNSTHPTSDVKSHSTITDVSNLPQNTSTSAVQATPPVPIRSSPPERGPQKRVEANEYLSVIPLHQKNQFLRPAAETNSKEKAAPKTQRSASVIEVANSRHVTWPRKAATATASNTVYVPPWKYGNDNSVVNVGKADSPYSSNESLDGYVSDSVVSNASRDRVHPWRRASRSSRHRGSHGRSASDPLSRSSPELRTHPEIYFSAATPEHPDVLDLSMPAVQGLVEDLNRRLDAIAARQPQITKPPTQQELGYLRNQLPHPPPPPPSSYPSGERRNNPLQQSAPFESINTHPHGMFVSAYDKSEPIYHADDGYKQRDKTGNYPPGGHFGHGPAGATSGGGEIFIDSKPFSSGAVTGTFSIETAVEQHEGGFVAQQQQPKEPRRVCFAEPPEQQVIEIESRQRRRQRGRGLDFNTSVSIADNLENQSSYNSTSSQPAYTRTQPNPPIRSQHFDQPSYNPYMLEAAAPFVTYSSTEVPQYNEELLWSPQNTYTPDYAYHQYDTLYQPARPASALGLVTVPSPTSSPPPLPLPPASPTFNVTSYKPRRSPSPDKQFPAAQQFYMTPLRVDVPPHQQQLDYALPGDAFSPRNVTTQSKSFRRLESRLAKGEPQENMGEQQPPAEGRTFTRRAPSGHVPRPRLPFVEPPGLYAMVPPGQEGAQQPPGIFAMFDKGFAEKLLQWQQGQGGGANIEQSKTYRLVKEMDQPHNF